MNKTTNITAARIILYQCMSCGTSPEIVRRKRGDKFTNKKLYRAFSQQANGLTLNISVLQGLLRVNGKAEKDA